MGKDKYLEVIDGGLASGQKNCTKDGPEDSNKFNVEFLADNKVALSQGGKYVKQKMNRYVNKLDSGTLSCKSSQPEYFNMTQGAGGYIIEGWTSSDNLINGNGGGGEEYHIELLDESRMAIKFDG